MTAASLRARSRDPISSRLPALNLPLIREKDEFQAEEVACSLLDIEEARKPHHYLSLMGVISLAAFLLLNVLPAEWEKIRIITGIVIGAGGGAMLPFLLPVWKQPRRIVDPYAAHRKFGPLERQQTGQPWKE